MAQQGLQVIQLGKEVTRGTAVTTTLAWAVINGQLRTNIDNIVVEKRPNVIFPYALQVPVGTLIRAEVEVDFNINNCRDILTMALGRTSGALYSMTILDNQYGVANLQLAGCVCTELVLSASRGSNPDQSNIFSATLRFECVSASLTGSTQSLTAAVASRFHLRHSTQLLNNVAQISKLLNCQISINNELGLGPVDASNVRQWIGDGAESQEIQGTYRFTETAKQTLILAGTELATNTLVLGTGNANETITLTMAKAQLSTRTLADEGGEMVEQYSIKPSHTGSAAPIVPTYGSSIGATVLF